MALRRSFIAGLGTTGVLLGFAALLLIVVGALIGFQSWPGNSSVGDARGVAIKDARLTGLRPVTLPAGSAKAATGAAAAHGAARASHKSRARDAQGVAGVRRTSSGKVEPASAGSGSGSSPTSSAGGSHQGVKGVSDGVADTVNTVTQTAGGRLGGATGPVGNVVVETGSAVSKTVKDLGVKAQGNAKLP
jgi:hypothetical protein